MTRLLRRRRDASRRAATRRAQDGPLSLAGLEEPTLMRSIYLLPMLSIDRPSTDIGKLLKGKMSPSFKGVCLLKESTSDADSFRDESCEAKKYNFVRFLQLLGGLPR